MQDDPFLHPVLTVHISVMKRLKLTSELFYCAHKLVDTSPDSAVTWFAAGTYYLLVENFEHARQYFKYVFFFVCVTRLLLCCNACVPYVFTLVCLYRGSLSAHTTSSSRTSSTSASVSSTVLLRVCVTRLLLCCYTCVFDEVPPSFVCFYQCSPSVSSASSSNEHAFLISSASSFLSSFFMGETCMLCTYVCVCRFYLACIFPRVRILSKVTISCHFWLFMLQTLLFGCRCLFFAIQQDLCLKPVCFMDI